MKTCSKCKKEKDYSSFSKSGKYYNSWCNECRAKSEKEKRKKSGIKEKPAPKIKDNFHKECLKCNEILHVDEFHKNKRGKLGRASYCKKCNGEYHRQLKKSNPDKYKKSARKAQSKRRKNNLEHCRSQNRIYQYNRKNKQKAQSDGTVTPEFMKKLYEKENCCWCGEFVPVDKRTAEHIKPLSLGGAHSIYNLDMACLSCNSSKKNFNNE